VYGRSAGNNLMTIIPNPDGSIVSCGVYSDSTQFQSQWDAAGTLLKVASNGDSLWMRRYNNYVNNPNPSSYSETLYGLVRTKDGGYITSGGVLNQPKSKSWVIKTDSMGCVTAGCGSLINGTYTATTAIDEQGYSKAGFKLYPNPAQDKLHLEWIHSPSSEVVTLKVITLLGQVVMETTSMRLPEQLDISTLPKGIYLLKLQVPGHTEHIVKFVKD
jgi:hypothetical protein